MDNKAAAIIVGVIVGDTLQIRYDEVNGRFAINAPEQLTNTLIDNINLRARNAGLTISRDDIEAVYLGRDAHSGLRRSWAVSEVLEDCGVATDDDVLAGERLRLCSRDGHVDVLKYGTRRYLCTAVSMPVGAVGITAGSELRLADARIAVEGMELTSIKALTPSQAHLALDYKYIPQCGPVADSIDSLYMLVNKSATTSMIYNSPDSFIRDFPSLLQECQRAGFSTWTLRGIVDYMFEYLRNRSYAQ